MPKQLQSLQDYSNKLIDKLPDFLNQTIDHRLKQNAGTRAGNASLSPSGFERVKDYWANSDAKKNRMINQLNQKRLNHLNTSIDTSLPNLANKLQPLTERNS